MVFIEKVTSEGKSCGVVLPLAMHMGILKITYHNPLSKRVINFIETVKGQGSFLWGSTSQYQAPRSLESNLASLSLSL